MAEFPLRAINSIKILKEEHELLEYLLAEIGTKALNTSISTAVSEVDLTSIKTYQQSHVILYSILDKYGFSADQCRQILSGVHSGKTIYSLDFELLRDRNRLYIRKRAEEYDHSIIIDKEGEYQIGKYIMRLNRSKDSVLPSDPWTELVHLPPDIFPLELRYWKKGDIFQPLGMVGSKKLSDFFVDQKIDRFSKGQIPVLAKGSEIYLVAGHRISEKIKIHSDMEELYRVNFSEYFRFDRDF
jgi:tRNA(Ile)-lysidine synthase